MAIATAITAVEVETNSGGNSMRIRIAVLALSLLCPVAGMAEESLALAKIWDKLSPAWDETSARLTNLVGESKQKLLADLAFAIVASEQCQGLELDVAKFTAAFDSLQDADFQKLPASAKAEFGPKVMGLYGVYIGLLTSESLLDQSSFCDYALKKQGKGDGAFWRSPATGDKK